MKAEAGSYIVVRNTDSVHGFLCSKQSWPKLPKLNARLTVACVHESKYSTPVNCGRDKLFFSCFIHLNLSFVS